MPQLVDKAEQLGGLVCHLQATRQRNWHTQLVSKLHAQGQLGNKPQQLGGWVGHLQLQMGEELVAIQPGTLPSAQARQAARMPAAHGPIRTHGHAPDAWLCPPACLVRPEHSHPSLLPTANAHHGIEAVLPRPPHARGRVDKVQVAVHQLLQARRVLVGQVAERLRVER